VINEGLSEMIGPFPVPSPRDMRERNDDPGQKRRGHRYSVHPSNHAIPVDYRDRRSVNYLDRSQAISREVGEIFERLGTRAEIWQARLQKLSHGRLLGRFFAASRERLREVAARLGLRRVPNLGGCSAS